MPRIVSARVAHVFRLCLAALAAILFAAPALAQDAVCAQVKIEIKQKLSLERQAFDAVMRINNGLDTDPIQNVGINLTFADQAGNSVIATTDPNNTSAAFFIRIDSLTGINAIDGSGAVAPKTTGEIHWLIIPAAGTGGIAPQGKLYFIGASLTYSLLGNTSTVAVTPDFVTVKPQPLLALDYFLAGDVYADDPFTPEIEPPVPFTLGVRIKNVGGGVAAKTSIESAQPKIVDNKQGLLIGFQILDSYVNDQPADKTLLINFGDIGPGTAAVGRWNMVTTLSGKFIDLAAGYTHADSLGGALTSLIQGISTHLLVHDVKVDLAGRDNIRDFLALDVDVLRVYESEGVDTLVTDQSANAHLQPGTPGKYNLTFQATTGFAYVKLPDPFAGQVQPGPVLRSDGKTLPAENVWLSQTRNANLTWSYFINFFDADTTGIYTVGLAGSGFASLSGTVFADANNNGVMDAGETGLGAVMVTLTGVDDQGAAVNTSGFTDAGGTWSFVQLRPGTYSVKVAAVSGYVDGKLAIGTAGGAASGDTISGIVLGAGVNATGYLFAKANPAPLSADVSVTMTASTTTVPLNANVTLTLVAANAGPGTATTTKVTDAVPASLSLVSAVAGAGSYDPVTGIWTVGDLPGGASATLALTAKVFSVSGPITNAATIASAVTDPNLANNGASVTLNPDAGTLDVTQAILRESRVLAFIDCGSGSGATCASDRANFLSAYLSGLGYGVKVVLDPAAFLNDFRGGRYNALWLSSDTPLSEALMEEIREAAFRGNIFIFDGPDGSVTDPLDEAAGVRTQKGLVGKNLDITIPGVAGTVATAGDARRLQLRGGQTYAAFAGGGSPPAIVTNDYGQGRGVVTSFDLVGTLQIPASETALHAFVVDMLGTRAPPVPAAFVGSSYVPVTTTIVNKAADADIEVIATLPAGVTLADANPAPVATTATQVTWRFPLPANQTALVDAGLRMPPVSGTFALQTDVNKLVGASTIPFGSYSFPITVAASDQFGPQLIAGLTGLTFKKLLERVTRDAAVILLKDGQNNLADGHDQVAIQRFLSAGNLLESITSIDVSPYEIATGRWLQEAEQRWFLGLPLCGSADMAPIAATGADFVQPSLPGAGLEVRGGRRATGLDWAWSLGAVPSVAFLSTQQSLDWVSGKTYGWTLVYNGSGQGTYIVSDGAKLLFSRTYSGSLLPLTAGNMLEFHIAASADAGAATMEVAVQTINGKPVNATLATPGNSQPYEAAADYYYPAMTGGFQLAGSIRVSYTSTAQLRDSLLDFTVGSGNSTCKAATP